LPKCPHVLWAKLLGSVPRGTKPGDIPVEQPTKFDLGIKLKTAKALRLAVPDRLLALADEVIDAAGVMELMELIFQLMLRK
jgi:hypothetical protein